jgi:hypothetical protein
MFFHFFLRISWIFAVEIAICNLHYLHIDLQWPKWIIDVCSIAEPQSALWSLAAVHLQILEAATTLQFLLETFPCRWVFLLGRSLGALKLDQCGRQGSWGAQWRNGDGTQGNFRVEIWKEFTLTLPMAKLENADWCSTHFRQWFLGSYCINDWEFWLFESLYFYSVFIRCCQVWLLSWEASETFVFCSRWIWEFVSSRLFRFNFEVFGGCVFRYFSCDRAILHQYAGSKQSSNLGSSTSTWHGLCWE